MTQLEDAIKFHRKGDLPHARELYLQILEAEPDNSAALNLIGVLCLQSSKVEEGRKYLEKAVDLNPCAPYLENLGLAYFCEGDLYLAVNAYKKALAQEETYETLEQLVKCYETLGIHQEALKYCEKLYVGHETNLDLIRKLAKLYNAVGNFPHAAKFYKKSLEHEPNDYVGMNNLGLVMESLGQSETAKKCYQKSLNLKKNYEAYHNLGVLCRNERDFDKSIEYLQKALAIQPENVESKISLGMAYLSKKDFSNGYKYYMQRNPKLRATYKNPWDGKPHPDKTLLIHFDGGHGDQIMFCRYIKYLKGYFKDIIFLVYPQLLEFFKLNFPDLRVMLATDKYEYDISANIMELHWHLGMDFEHIPSEPVYLKADETKTKLFKEKYFNNTKTKIGLFWQGNKRVFKNRAIKLENLEVLFSINNTVFYSVQKNDEEKQILKYPQIVDFDGIIGSFSDTAALIKNFDIMITIDSAVAHMAGALGVKTYLLLPYASEWRWFSETTKTQWYPSVEIFKQSEPGDWTKAMAQISEKLQNKGDFGIFGTKRLQGLDRELYP